MHLQRSVAVRDQPVVEFSPSELFSSIAFVVVSQRQYRQLANCLLKISRIEFALLGFYGRRCFAYLSVICDDELTALKLSIAISKKWRVACKRSRALRRKLAACATSISSSSLLDITFL